jgi:hypothetical protein
MTRNGKAAFHWRLLWRLTDRTHLSRAQEEAWRAEALLFRDCDQEAPGIINRAWQRRLTYRRCAAEVTDAAMMWFPGCPAPPLARRPGQAIASGRAPSPGVRAIHRRVPPSRRLPVQLVHSFFSRLINHLVTRPAQTP